MPKNNIPPAEAYAQREADKWLFDAQGYCPFTMMRLGSVIRKAFEDGAASVMSTNNLTPGQKEVLLNVINERIAGGTDQLRDALGLTNVSAAAYMRVLRRVEAKLMVGRESYAGKEI